MTAGTAPNAQPSALTVHADHARFVALSEVLCGVPGLDVGLAGEYVELIANAPSAALLPQLLDAFDEAMVTALSKQEAADHVAADATLGPLARALILLWYTGVYQDPKDAAAPTTQLPAHAVQALLWSAVGAHPPGLSGGYMGYWAYPPEN